MLIYVDHVDTNRLDVDTYHIPLASHMSIDIKMLDHHWYFNNFTY